MTSAILALDLGTTSCRALILTDEGTPLAWAQQEFTQYFPAPGFVEHDAQEIFSCILSVAKRALKTSSLPITAIKGIGISNQRETTLIWDRKTGEPISRAIVWQDRRTAAYCLEMKSYETLVQEKTGLLIDPYFSATKIRALLAENSEKIKGKSLLFGTLDSWLIYKLTEGKAHVTDMTNASRTLIYNIHTLAWDEQLLTLFGIPHDILPEVKSCSEVYGTTSLFGGEIPICGCMGDQQASLFGQMAFDAGVAKCTYGTGAFLLMQTGNKAFVSKNRLLTTIASSIGDEVTYALEGSIFVTGAAVQWLRDGLHLIGSSNEIESLARSVDDSNGLVFVPSFTGLGAPYWDPLAQGALLGLTRATQPGHIARALLEGIAYSIEDLLNAMRADSHIPLVELRVDGGGSSDQLLMQLQSDVSQIPLLKPAQAEASALGAAYLAGLSAGLWRTKEALKTMWQLDQQYQPQRVISSENWRRGIQAVRLFHE